MNRNTFFVLFLLISNLVSGQDLKLWYSQPAQNWSEALPIGNSRLGAMVYGGIEREELQLNEETFWAGSPYNNNNPNAVHVLPVGVSAGKSISGHVCWMETMPSKSLKI